MNKFDKETKRNEFFDLRDSELDRLIDSKTGKISAHLVEKIDCPLCQCKKYTNLFVKNGFDFVRCNNCAFIYVNPRVREEKIIEYYNEETSTHDAMLEFFKSQKQQEVEKKLYKEIFEKIQKKVPSGKLLDIGCSIGLFLSVAKKLGYDVLGMELNEKAAKYAEDNHGIPVVRKLLEEANFSDNSFDVISMFGVIEHLTDPVKTISDVHRILKPGGLFIGRCPNVQSLVCMILHGLSRTFTGRLHLSYFSYDTLVYLFKKVGFKKWDISTVYAGKESIINYFQFLDPFSDEEDRFLPEQFREFLSDEKNMDKLEKRMHELGIGLKFMFFIEK